MTIQVKATEQYFHVVFVTLQDGSNVNKILKCDEQYFYVVLFTTLFTVVLAFESVDEILKCDHSNESH